MEPRRLKLLVTTELAGIRVGPLLRRHLHLSGTVLRRIKWLEDGILADGVRVNTRYVPNVGQVISVRLSDPDGRARVVPVPGSLDIVYEDEDLIVVNKPPGLTVHPGPGHYADTLGNFLTHYYKNIGSEVSFHPVHRLDRGTSGLLVIAKHPHAQERLKGQIHTRDFRRIYLAVCQGVPQPPAGAIDAPLGPVEGSLMARQVRADGKPARTRYETVKTVKNHALLRLELDTGRTHQIRVHLSHTGHPLVGDFLYGTQAPGLIPRPALHSHELFLRQPVTGEQLHFVQPLPEDMENLLR